MLENNKNTQPKFRAENGKTEHEMSTKANKKTKKNPQKKKT